MYVLKLLLIDTTENQVVSELSNIIVFGAVHESFIITAGGKNDNPQLHLFQISLLTSSPLTLIRAWEQGFTEPFHEKVDCAFV